jgi:hypothetical protein
LPESAAFSSAHNGCQKEGKSLLLQLELPVARAVMVGDEIVVEGSNASRDKVEAVICRCLGLADPSLKRRESWTASSGTSNGTTVSRSM